MKRLTLALLAATVMAAGVSVSLLSYLVPPTAFNPVQAAGSGVFWAGTFLLLDALFLAAPLKLALAYVRTKAGAALGGAYAFVHLLLYGLVLEWIVVAAYRIPGYVSAPLAFVTTDALYPANLFNALLGDAFSPSVNLQAPPVFDLSLSLFSVFAAAVIDVLILANVAKVKEIGARSLAASSRAYVLMPVTGVVLGASCCMSLPVVLSFAAPSLAGAAWSLWAFYAAYFVFPPLAVVVLKLNLDLASRIAEKARAPGSPAA